MRHLCLLRHAKSSWDEPARADHERPLNGRGRRDAPAMGRRWRARGLLPDRIVSSSAERAWATACAVARELGYPLGDIVREPALYLADPRTLLAVVRATDDTCTSLMLVGHNPGLTDFANRLTARPIDNLPTCGLYCGDFDVAHWRDLEPGTGRFVCFESPKRLAND